MKNLSCSVDQCGVPRISAMQMEDFAQGMLEEFDPKITRRPIPTCIDLFVEMYLDAHLEIRSLTMTQEILGVTIFNGGCIPVYDRPTGQMVPLIVTERTIIIEQGLVNPKEPGRFNFTLAHEAGHLACHSDVKLSSGTVYRLESGSTAIMCRETMLTSKTNRTPTQWLEWQANYMGGALLMPRKTTLMAVDNALVSLGQFKGALGWRAMSNNPMLRQQVAKYISALFKTSIRTAEVRLDQLKELEGTR